MLQPYLLRAVGTLRTASLPLCAVRKLQLCRPCLGPGADWKYKSQEQREQEASKGRRKRQLMLAGLLGGGLAGALYAYNMTDILSEIVITWENNLPKEKINYTKKRTI